MILREARHANQLQIKGLRCRLKTQMTVTESLQSAWKIEAHDVLLKNRGRRCENCGISELQKNTAYPVAVVHVSRFSSGTDWYSFCLLNVDGKDSPPELWQEL